MIDCDELRKKRRKERKRKEENNKIDNSKTKSEVLAISLFFFLLNIFVYFCLFSVRFKTQG